jgi:hypothetical protein
VLVDVAEALEVAVDERDDVPLAEVELRDVELEDDEPSPPPSLPEQPAKAKATIVRAAMRARVRISTWGAGGLISPMAALSDWREPVSS